MHLINTVCLEHSGLRESIEGLKSEQEAQRRELSKIRYIMIAIALEIGGIGIGVLG